MTGETRQLSGQCNCEVETESILFLLPACFCVVVVCVCGPQQTHAVTLSFSLCLPASLPPALWYQRVLLFYTSKHISVPSQDTFLERFTHESAVNHPTPINLPSPLFISLILCASDIPPRSPHVHVSRGDVTFFVCPRRPTMRCFSPNSDVRDYPRP